MSIKDFPINLQPYVYHNLQLNYSDGDSTAYANCFVCGSEDRFAISTDKGTWICSSCSEKGNSYTFLEKLYEISANNYVGSQDTDTLEILVKAKNLSIPILERWRIVPSCISDDLIAPAYNGEGNLSNLFKIGVKGDNWYCYSTPKCKAHALGRHLLEGNECVYLCEGPWDAMSLDMLLLDNEVDACTLSLNGVTSMYDELAPFLPEKVVIAFDNDHPRLSKSGKKAQPAWTGTQSTKKILERHGDHIESISLLHWGDKTYHDASLPDGYDLSDLIHDHKDPWSEVQRITRKTKRKAKTQSSSKNEKSEETSQLDPLPCESFQDLSEKYREVLHVTDRIEDTLAVMLAVVISTPIPGEQLWLRVIGPAASGKTTLAETISAAKKHVFPISLQTGFHSGYVRPGQEKTGEDNSLLPKMNGKTTIIKDGDTLLNASGRDRILSELRDIYDGSSRAIYRNTVNHNYEDLRITFIICGTRELRTLNRSFLGERFLDYEIVDANYTHDEIVDVAFDNALSQIATGFESTKKEDLNKISKKQMENLKRYTIGYIDHTFENLEKGKPPAISIGQQSQIKALAKVLALSRARIKMEKGEMVYRAQAESPTRLVKQFVKLSLCLAIVLGKRSVDKEVLRILKNVFYDTAHSFELEIIQTLAQRKDSRGLTASQLANSLDLSLSSVTQRLKDMAHFNITGRNKRTNNSGQGGRDVHIWKLTPQFRKLYRIANR